MINTSQFKTELKDKKGIFNLFFYLERFIGPIVIQILYWIALISSVLFLLFGILASLTEIFYGRIIIGLGGILLAIIVFAIGLLFTRLVFEGMIIVYKNNEYLKKIASK